MLKPDPGDPVKPDLGHGSGPQPWYTRFNAVVVLILVIFLYLYYVAVFCVIVPWFSYSVPGFTNLGVLTCTTGLALFCYIFCVVVDPGRVPPGWTPDSEVEVAVQEVKRKDGTHRFCQKCQEYKPPRSHHCRVCKRCVLRMDHHCPWMNNCIGNANYRVFFLFLVYVNAALVHVVGLLISHSLHTLQSSRLQLVIRTGPTGTPIHLSNGLQNIWLWALMQTLALGISMPLTIALLMLLVWHVHLLMYNKTTIEHQEGITARVKALAFGEVYRHPYHLGLLNNLHAVLGHSAATWVCPTCTPATGGTAFLTIWDEPASPGFGF